MSASNHNLFTCAATLGGELLSGKWIFSEVSVDKHERTPQNSMTSDPSKVWPRGTIRYHIIEKDLG